jgi:hypothetical protein
VPDITELLERTTPESPPDFDVADLVRRGRRRRRRARVGSGVVGVALVAAGGAGLGLVAPDDQGQVVASRPPVGEVAEAFAAAGEPLGIWEQVADPPFSPRMGSFTETASDGRVVVWGGTADNEGRTGLLTDGGVYDPEAGRWEGIAPAPVVGGAQSMSYTQLAGDRLFVLAVPDGEPGPWDAAVYDLDARRWTEVGRPPSIELPAEGIAWTGDTLALVRFWSGASVDQVATYSEPVVERWSYETGEWETGAPPPLSNRFGAYVAFDGERLAAWGGSRQDVELGSLATGAELVGDGAVYDVAADRWEPLAPSPLPLAMQGTAVWLKSGELAVAGGVVEDRSESPVMRNPDLGMDLLPMTAGATFDPVSRRWSNLAEPPQNRSDAYPVGTFVVEAAAHSLTATDLRSRSPRPTSYFDEITNSWLPVPLPDLHTIDGTLVATSRTRDNPGSGPLKVQVLAGSVWEPATEAPFVNRMDAGVTVTGQNLFVVGGAEGPDLDIAGDAWLLRFDT